VDHLLSWILSNSGDPHAWAIFVDRTWLQSRTVLSFVYGESREDAVALFRAYKSERVEALALCFRNMLVSGLRAGNWRLLGLPAPSLLSFFGSKPPIQSYRLGPQELSLPPWPQKATRTASSVKKWEGEEVGLFKSWMYRNLSYTSYSNRNCFYVLIVIWMDRRYRCYWHQSCAGQGDREKRYRAQWDDAGKEHEHGNWEKRYDTL